jgi:DNA-binding FrmR family transcriptional regulator
LQARRKTCIEGERMSHTAQARMILLARVRRLQARIVAIKEGLLKGKDRRIILRQIAAAGRDAMDTLMVEGLKAHDRPRSSNQGVDSGPKRVRGRRGFA